MPLGKDIRVLNRREIVLVTLCRLVGCGLGAFVAALAMAQPRSMLSTVLAIFVLVTMALSTAAALWLRHSPDPMLPPLLDQTLLFSCLFSGLSIISFALPMRTAVTMPWPMDLATQAIYTLFLGLTLSENTVPKLHRLLWRTVNIGCAGLAMLGFAQLAQSQPDAGSMSLLLTAGALFGLLCGLAPALLLHQGATAESGLSSSDLHRLAKPRYLYGRLLFIALNAAALFMLPFWSMP